MFNSMKNQFREKTGKDLPKFTPQKGGLSRQSRQGSESSVCSLVLENSQQQSSQQSQSSAAIIPVTSQDIHPIKLNDGKVLTNKEINIITKKEEEWRNRLEKKEAELNKKWEKREADLMQELAHKSEEWRKKEQEITQELLKQTNEVKAVMKMADEYKRKICQYQEDKDQLEGFQTQEMAKVKHLLLAKEKENNEMAISLKENIALVETLKSEVNRLRPFEEQISNFQVGRLSRQAGEEGAERRTAEAKLSELEAKLDEELKEKQRLSTRITSLTEECDSLAAELKTANNQLDNLKGQLKKLQQ